MKQLAILFIFLFLIENLFSQAVLNEIPAEYLSEHFYDHPFGAITEDYELKLWTHYDDCGEFGGHEETIVLGRIEDQFTATYTVYAKSCDGKGFNLVDTVSSRKILIEYSQLPIFNQYVDSLTEKSFKFIWPHHAGRRFNAILGFNDERSEMSLGGFRILYVDSKSEWDLFDRLKKKLEL